MIPLSYTPNPSNYVHMSIGKTRTLTKSNWDVIQSNLSSHAGLKAIVDFIPNHTSDQAAWFAESVSAQQGDDMYDFYVWGEPATEADQPNAWVSEDSLTCEYTQLKERVLEKDTNHMCTRERTLITI